MSIIRKMILTQIVFGDILFNMEQNSAFFGGADH